MSGIYFLAFLALCSPTEPPVSSQEATLQRANYTPKLPYFVYDVPHVFNPLEMPADIYLEYSARLRLCEGDPVCLRVYPFTDRAWAFIFLRTEFLRQSGYLKRGASRTFIVSEEDLRTHPHSPAHADPPLVGLPHRGGN